MQMVELIRKKRDGGALAAAETRFWVEQYVAGAIPDYQVSALLMAIYFRGLDEQETVDLTLAMRDSGAVMDFSDLPGLKVDKHSTGGVGDKTTLIVAPIVAAAGLLVAKMSGRGLGHTGGTADKLESIPGFQIGLPVAEFKRQVEEVGLAIVSQTGELAPADKLLYALRDVTGTVESSPLIAASIMSKKLAMNADALVLDVKYGAGALMKEIADSRELARQMVRIGRAAGKQVSALVTAMRQPLGCAVGNALEVREVLAVLAGSGPEDLRELSLALAGELIYLGGKAADRQAAVRQAEALLRSGAAQRKFYEFVQAQGGTTDFSKLPQAPVVLPVYAKSAGYVSEIQAEQVGLAALALGAGRAVKEAEIDPAVGIMLLRKLGADVAVGDLLAEIHCRDEEQGRQAELRLREAVQISPEIPESAALIAEIL